VLENNHAPEKRMYARSDFGVEVMHKTIKCQQCRMSFPTMEALVLHQSKFCAKPAGGMGERVLATSQAAQGETDFPGEANRCHLIRFRHSRELATENFSRNTQGASRLHGKSHQCDVVFFNGLHVCMYVCIYVRSLLFFSQHAMLIL
jgi:hypothetical protein